MVLNDIKNIVNFVIKERSPALTELTIGRFNGIAEEINILLFDYYYENKLFVFLRPFKVVKGWNESQALSVNTNGQVTIPSDYFRYSELSHTYSKDVENSKTVPVNVVGEDLWTELITSTIEYPTKQYPIANFQATIIRIRPVNLRYINMSYFKQPTAPVLGVEFTEGYNKYDLSGTTELVWDEVCKPKFIQLFLANLGIPLKMPEILKFIQEQKIIEDAT